MTSNNSHHPNDADEFYDADGIESFFLARHSNLIIFLDVDHYINGIQRDLMKHWTNLTRQQFGR